MRKQDTYDLTIGMLVMVLLMLMNVYQQQQVAVAEADDRTRTCQRALGQVLTELRQAQTKAEANAKRILELEHGDVITDATWQKAFAIQASRRGKGY